MPIYSFQSDAPYLDDVGITHNTEIGRSIDELMRSAAYLDPADPKHHWTRGQVEARMALVYGEKPVEGGQPFSPVSFSTADGSVIPR